MNYHTSKIKVKKWLVKSFRMDWKLPAYSHFQTYSHGKCSANPAYLQMSRMCQGSDTMNFRYKCILDSWRWWKWSSGAQAVLPIAIFRAECPSTILLHIIRDDSTSTIIPSSCYLLEWHWLWKTLKSCPKPWLCLHWKILMFSTAGENKQQFNLENLIQQFVYFRSKESVHKAWCLLISDQYRQSGKHSLENIICHNEIALELCCIGISIAQTRKYPWRRARVQHRQWSQTSPISRTYCLL